MTKSAHDFYQIGRDRMVCPFPMRGLELWFAFRYSSADANRALAQRQKQAHAKPPEFHKDYPNLFFPSLMNTSGRSVERNDRGRTYLPLAVVDIGERYTMACAVEQDRMLHRALLREFRKRGMTHSPGEFNPALVYYGLVLKWPANELPYMELRGNHEILARLTKEGEEGAAVMAAQITDAVQESLIG